MVKSGLNFGVCWISGDPAEVELVRGRGHMLVDGGQRLIIQVVYWLLKTGDQVILPSSPGWCERMAGRIPSLMIIRERVDPPAALDAQW